ncbi:hypothetical protein AtubIFM55763_006955 [Aspergillus tubingensis]|uniref:Asl1-like glycosyl hydrolase catalytic domain-containing protein n=3 Tax=Aspergillus subgen. Circumdati TaxID=2720871 RepID=A0A1L9N008_ASPTC|nr:glycoside hydrolase family 128 protein [Aspergillus tubingensis]OJI82623.1 hypothetical protein ASPTUDRAFT_56654 [Aspergillus tubingensis CBS 134.48]GAQ42075.1 similar to An11g01660 [Aspergillus niger]GFN16685.1 glycoside hydrolase family 128 protein [Aspergillus tubingensis]GLA63065.1 hypothetical protein AtubIFM54640_004202 [Aspergillus tubingensis]GLA68756.1 hypothetical protein AtubIFM55763_006955 [Aspergillus tubingensis]
MVSFKSLLTATTLATAVLAIPHGGHGHGSHKHRSTHVASKRGSSSKRGAAYTSVSNVHTLTSGSSGNGTVSWAYDWNMYADGSLPSNVEYVPMLWGSKMFGGWLTAIETALDSGSNYIMGFNEPDASSQASMTASEAASSYKKYITPYSGKAKLVTPAVTSSTTEGEGLSWMKSFLSECSECDMSVLAVHWYGTTADEFKSFVQEAMQVADDNGLDETWVTEFALTSGESSDGDQTSAADFLDEVLPWLDSQSGVGRYAYYMCADGYLLSGEELSSSGKVYVA